MNIKHILTIFLKGLFMGTADIIPGVSGGTIALITGIYERLIHSISRIDPRFLIHILKGDIKKASEKIRRIDFELFVPLLAGIGLAIWLMSNVITFMLDTYTAYTFAFFFGLILASAVIIYRTTEGLSAKNIAFAVIGFLFAFLFTGLSGIDVSHSLPVIFLSGAIVICAMILPGISGAFILLFLGQYEFMLSALRNLQMTEIAVFSAGALIGILLFSRFLHHLLKKYRSYTMFFLIGLMIGALRIPYMNIMQSMESVLPAIISGIAGFAIILLIERPSNRSVQKTLNDI